VTRLLRDDLTLLAFGAALTLLGVAIIRAVIL